MRRCLAVGRPPPHGRPGRLRPRAAPRAGAGGAGADPGAFAGRLDDLPPAHYFPEVRRRFDRYPTVEATEAAFGEAGFRRRRFETVEEHTIDLAEWRRLLPDQRRSDTALVQLTDDEFAAGLRRVDADIAAGRARPRTALDLLVLA